MSSYCRLYESPVILQSSGEVIHPGGLHLTERLFQLMAPKEHSTMLDIGCGVGGTMEYINQQYDLMSIGIDPSDKLLCSGKERNGSLRLLRGYGERLPFAGEGVDCVLAECSLSLQVGIDDALQEIHRVLKTAGLLYMSDVYIRNSRAIPALRQLPLHSCLCGALTRQEVCESLDRNGFELLCWEDHTKRLTEFAASMILAHGSLAEFWGCVSKDRQTQAKIQTVIQHSKPGYFILAAQKRGGKELM